MATELDILVKATDQASGVFRRISAAGSGLGSRFSRIGQRMSSQFRAIGVAAGIGLGVAAVGIKKTIDAASDLNESVSKVGVVFGSSRRTILAWSKSSATAMGLSQQAALEAAGTFGNLFRSMKFTEEKSADMSTQLVQLAGDLASFNNADPEEVLINLRAGLLGEAEPLRKFGVQLSAARTEAEALRMGLIKEGQTLTAQQKAYVNFGLILKDTSLAQGDFARTADGVANRQRIVAAQTANLSAKIGKLFLPIWQRVLSSVQRGLSFLTKMTNIVGKRGLAGVIEYLEERVRHVWEAFTGWFAGLSQSSKGFVAALIGVGAVLAAVFAPAIVVIAAVAAGAILIAKNWGPISAVFQRVWKAVKPLIDTLGKTLWNALKQVWAVIQKNLLPSLVHLWQAIKPVVMIVGGALYIALLAIIKALPIVVRAIAAVINIFAGLINGVKNVIVWIGRLIGWVSGKLVGAWQALKDILTGLWDGVISVGTQALNFIIDGVNMIITGMNKAIDLLDKAAGPFINFGEIPKVPQLANGGVVTRPTMALIGERGPEAVIPLNRAGLGGQAVQVFLDRRRFGEEGDFDQTYRGW